VVQLRDKALEAREGTMSDADIEAIGAGVREVEVGDMVAAPGCLSEIAWASAVEASRLAVAAAQDRHARVGARAGSAAGAGGGTGAGALA